MSDAILAVSTLAKTSGSPVVGTDVFRIVRSSGPTSYQVTAAHIATYMATAMAALAVTVGSLNIGNADTTIARVSAGDISVEGNLIYRAGGTDVPITDGGTGASTAGGALTNLGFSAAHQ